MNKTGIFILLFLWIAPSFAKTDFNCDALLNLSDAAFRSLAQSAQGTPALPALNHTLTTCYANSFCNDSVCAQKLSLRMFLVNTLAPARDNTFVDHVTDQVMNPQPAVTASTPYVNNQNPPLQHTVEPSFFNDINW